MRGSSGPTGGGGGGGGIKVTPSGPLGGATATPGYSPAKADVLLFGLLQIGALLNWLSDLITEDKIRQDITETEQWIRRQQEADPHMGILVVVELLQGIPPESGEYWPARMGGSYRDPAPDSGGIL